MGNELSLKDGGIVINLVRKAIEEWVKNNKTVHDWPQHNFFNERHGILLSLYYGDGKLHGRIGYPYPVKSAADVLVRCAVSVCQDPRSPALKAADLKNVIAEVSILSEPRIVLKPYEKNFDPAGEGLIIVRGAKTKVCNANRAQETSVSCEAMIMPADFNGAAEAIAEAAKRAEIEKNLINDPLTKFYKFSSQTFFETSPEGPVQEKVYGAAKLIKLVKKPAKGGAKTKKRRRNK